MEFKPHDYQRYCIDRILDTPAVALMLDMGLGKTVITLTALQELKFYRFETRKALVIAPKRVAEGTWTNEAAKWDHLAGLRLSVVLGSEAQRLKALRTPADVYIINRENTQWLVQTLGRAWDFDTVVLDESTSFKNHQAKRFRALKVVRPRIRRVIELTGTPSPRGLTDLWAQLYLLDGGERLGRTVSTYREMFFYPDKRNATTVFTYTPREGAPETIYRLISDICISMRAEDYLSMPDLIVDDIPVVLDEAARKAYRRMERDMLLEIDGETITATAAATLTGKLLQLCNGAVYSETGEAVAVHDCKLEALLETIEQLNGQHAIIYYYFKHDRERILKALAKSELSVKVYENQRDADAWNAGKIDLLLAQPASCGYGLNLQGGGHHIIWFGLTWSLEEYLQANARLHRQGQAWPVIVHRLITKGGADEDVIRSLNSKDGQQSALLEAVKARISAVNAEKA